MGKTKEELEELKQIRMNNMLRWTKEDYEFYSSFFKDVFGLDEVPYWDEVQKLKQKRKKRIKLN